MSFNLHTHIGGITKQIITLVASPYTIVLRSRIFDHIPTTMAWDTRAQILVGAWVIDLGIQLLGWTGAVLLQSEYFYDLLGSATYLTLALGSLIYGGTYHALQILMTTLVAVWALRLGTFLFTRVIKAGGDSRFHELKTKPCTCRFVR